MHPDRDGVGCATYPTGATCRHGVASIGDRTKHIGPELLHVPLDGIGGLSRSRPRRGLLDGYLRNRPGRWLAATDTGHRRR